MHLGLLLTLLFVFAPLRLLADSSATCKAQSRGGRAALRITVERLFDADLLRLIRLGLHGSLVVDATLIRPRALWFDERIAAVKRRFRARYDRTLRRVVLDGGPELNGSGGFVLDSMALGFEDKRRDAYEVDVETTLEVVTAQSLAGMARWISDEDPRSRVGLVSQEVLRAVAGDLRRHASAHCAVTR